MVNDPEVPRQSQQSGHAKAQNAESNHDVQKELLDEIREIANNALERQRLAKRLTDAVHDAEVSAGEQRNSTYLQHTGRPQNERASERKALKRDIIRALKAVEEGVIEAPSESNKALLVNLSQKVGTQLTEANAAYIQPIVSKLLETNQTIDDLKVQFATLKNEWGSLGSIDIVDKVAEAIIESARDGNLAITEEQARNEFSIGGVVEKRDSSNPFDGIVPNEYLTAFKTFFGDDPEDIRVIKAIYSKEDLKDFFEYRKQKVSETAGAVSDEKLWQLVSEDVEREIVLRMTKVFMRIDQQKPTQPWEQESAEGGMFDNPRIIRTAMLNALESLRGKTDRMTDAERQEFFGGMKFYRRVSDEKGEEFKVKFGEVKDKKGKIIKEGQLKTVYRHNIKPLVKSEQVGIGQFLDDVHTMVEHEIEARGYLHNIKLAFMNPAGEGGFWGGLSRFAEQMRSTDIDSLMYLPDNHLFLTVYRLYTKFLEEEFALLDWRHRPNMFSPDLFNNRNKIEQRVEEALKKLFPIEVGNDQKDQWRIRRAMSMGIGLARGVLLTEVELAAYAEPGVDIHGRPLLTSQYTNDGVALSTLNPQHHFLRWQSESALRGTLVFMPLIGLFSKTDSKFMRGHWDHRAMMQMAQRHHKSYIEGKGVYADRPEGEKLFIDFLPGFAKAGGYFTRGGWRFEQALAGSIRRERAADGTEKIDPLRTWKAIENIGYEALKALATNGEFMKRLKDNVAGSSIRQYMFDTYINKNGRSGMTLEEYYKKIEGQLKRHGGKVSEDDVHSFFVQQTLAHLLVQRIPTKLIKLQRDRQTVGGIRAFTKVREMAGLKTDEMNELMENLMIVEAKVRTETSESILRAGNEDLAEVRIDTYYLDENRIRSVLGAAGFTEDKIAATVNLYKKIEEFTFSGEVGNRFVDEFAYRLHKGDFPFSIAAEEVDFSIMPLRAAGERVLARVLGDNGKIEKDVFENMTKYINKLQTVAVDGKKNVHELVQILEHMHSELDQIHGHAIANKVVYAMAAVTIGYFRRDTVADNWWSKIGSVGRKNSLAAEFSGSPTTRGVWEWGVEEVNNFIVELEKNSLFRPKSISFNDWEGTQIEDRKFLGLIPYKKTLSTHEHGDVPSGRLLRKSFGASYGDVIKKIFTHYGPAVALGILYMYISKALKETSEKK